MVITSPEEARPSGPDTSRACVNATYRERPSLVSRDPLGGRTLGVVTLLDLTTPDGTAETYLSGSGPGVLFFIDAIGLRPQTEQMADRIAGWGYAVLVPNVLYRSGTAAETSPGPDEDLREPGARERFFEGASGRVRTLTPERVERDVPVWLSALREHAEGRDVGVVGYCMGARLAVRTACLDPDVVACAGFHGGGLATDGPDSPHLGLPRARAEFVFGHADRDRSMGPEAVARLGQALSDAGLTATNEVYPGSPHGYSMDDTSMYDEAGAERSFAELRALLDRTLRP
jgi:carboxymethylenebutenolidase